MARPSRPYFNKGVRELEEIFTAAGGDRVTLEALRRELGYRKTPKAVALAKRVAASCENLSLPFDDGAGAGGPPVIAPARNAPTKEASSAQGGIAPPEPLALELESSATDLPEPRTPELPALTGHQLNHPEVEDPGPDALLATWTTLEVLEPQPMPEPRDLVGTRRKMIQVTEEEEPWRGRRWSRRGREKAVFWFIYLGELDLNRAMRALLEQFQDDSPEPAPNINGTSPLAVLVLDEDGCPVPGKTFLSSFAWGYGRVRAGELRTLASFDHVAPSLCTRINSWLSRQNEEGELLPVTLPLLRQATEQLVQELQLTSLDASLDPVYVRVPVWGWPDPPEPELLNSFFLGDLKQVRRELNEGALPRALREFLAGRPSRSRVDAVKDLWELAEQVDPARIPLSRWPVRGKFSLNLMQQVAINHAVDELSTGGLMGINGPPGTGKTTLLRDIVAKVVVDRASALACFGDPVEAFRHLTPMKLGSGYTHLYELDKTLRDQEIVVASSNNQAVENISRELPRASALAEGLDIRYFSSIAETLFEGDARGAECWGLAAAVLGNSANRHRFVQRFWWDREFSMQQYLRGVADGWEATRVERKDDEDGPAAVLQLEEAPRGRDEALERWRAACDRFASAKKRVADLAGRSSTFAVCLRDRSAAERALQEKKKEIAYIGQERVSVLLQVEEAKAELVRVQRNEADATEARRDHERLRPNWWARLLHTRRHRAWISTLKTKTRAVEQARDQRRQVERQLDELTKSYQNLKNLKSKAEDECRALERRNHLIGNALRKARALFGENLPDHYFWSRSSDERQRLSPWIAADFQRAREALFRASFELHRAFIDAAAKPLRHNLGAAMALLKGRKLTEKQEPARVSLWSSLFLVVPVISTTFASMERMFGPLGREQIGWLLIDEAGQATPQAAVGAIWRSRRVIAIGDPQQVEPVVTLPRRLTAAIASEHGVDAEHWTAPRSSVQSLADRASWFGTSLTSNEGSTWIGSPLRVHRRCEDPMFTISNRVAYDGLMVQATPSGASPIGARLGPSGWYHVEGDEPGHWSAREGEVAAALLRAVLAGAAEPPDIFFITPFRAVKLALRDRLRQEVAAVVEKPWQWVADRVNTIHGFQGREAEAVVLVLGAPSHTAAGARRWAGGSPNLLNVAVSRAKRRLYVIGDRNSWRGAGVFGHLVSNLPLRHQT